MTWINNLYFIVVFIDTWILIYSQVPDGRCFYEGIYRQPGTSWQVGCKYKCTCVRRMVQCQQLCLKWNLPSICSIDPPAPGKCCETPRCPPSIHLRYPPGYPLEEQGDAVTETEAIKPSTDMAGGGQEPVSDGTKAALTDTAAVWNGMEHGECIGGGMQHGCSYQNQTYQENDTWQLGCKYKCTCVNAMKNQIVCSEFLCLQWRLPSVCTLNPPAEGECCPTPNCPPGVDISFLPGLEPESASTGGTKIVDRSQAGPAVVSKLTPESASTGGTKEGDRDIKGPAVVSKLSPGSKSTGGTKTGDRAQADPAVVSKLTPESGITGVTKTGDGAQAGPVVVSKFTLESAITGGTKKDGRAQAGTAVVSKLTPESASTGGTKSGDGAQAGPVVVSKLTPESGITGATKIGDGAQAGPVVVSKLKPESGITGATKIGDGAQAGPAVVSKLTPESGITGATKIGDGVQAGPVVVSKFTPESAITSGTKIDGGAQAGPAVVSKLTQESASSSGIKTVDIAQAGPAVVSKLTPDPAITSGTKIDGGAQAGHAVVSKLTPESASSSGTKTLGTAKADPAVVSKFTPESTSSSGIKTGDRPQVDHVVLSKLPPDSVSSSGAKSGDSVQAGPVVISEVTPDLAISSGTITGDRFQAGSVVLSELALESASNRGIKTGMQPGCFYKDQVYKQDDTWKVGCQYKCTCVNAVKNEYRCRDLCPKWQLPSVCSMDPPTSGKCCPIPKCPPGFTINYPPGFLQDMGISSGLAEGQKPKIETIVSDSSVTKTETSEPVKDTGSTNQVSETSRSSGFSNLKTILEVGSVGINSGMKPGCVYKKHVYKQEETWQIGCQYLCKCVNAAKNEYQCRGLCLKWNLPSVCTLDPPADGECCPKPNCPQNVVLNYPQGYTQEKGIGMRSGCFHNGQWYQQDESWQVGCQYKCTCLNAVKQEYECKDLCLKWQLPASCQLKQPADGQCCPVPECPSNVKLVYPPGYGQKATESVPGTQTGKSETTVLGTEMESSVSGTGGSIANMNTQSMQETKIDSTGKLGGVMTGKDMQMGMTSACLYKDTLYQDGDTWRDKCQFRCSCVGGFTQCRSLCPTWQLPGVCSLKPAAPGKCCQTPDCPSYITVNYPPGFTSE